MQTQTTTISDQLSSCSDIKLELENKVTLWDQLLPIMFYENLISVKTAVLKNSYLFKRYTRDADFNPF